MNGNDISTFKDPTGKALFVDFVNVVRKDGAGFVPYEWPKPGFDKPQQKLSYVAGFAPWNWVMAPVSISTTSRRRPGLRPGQRCWPPAWCCC